MGEAQLWTHSRIKARMNCPMAECLRYQKCIAPLRRKDALVIGSAVHKGIETWSVEEALKEFDDIFPSDQNEANELEIAKATVTAMLTGYFEQYEPFENHKPEIAFKLHVILPGGRKSRKHFIAGKIDDIERTDEGDWIVEYKTAGQITGAYFDRLHVDGQVTMYCYAAKRLGYNPIGVKYRVIRKPTIRPRKGESVVMYINRLIEDYRARPEFYFTHRTLYRSEEQLASFEKELGEKVLRFAADAKKGINWRNDSHCTNYGACAYLPLCSGESGAEALYEYREPHEELGFNNEEDNRWD